MFGEAEPYVADLQIAPTVLDKGRQLPVHHQVRAEPFHRQRLTGAHALGYQVSS